MCGFARPCDQQLRLPIGNLDLPLLWTIGSGSHTAETEASWARPRRVLLVIWPDDCDQEAHRPLTQWVPGGPFIDTSS